jgi:HSP20 family protein
MALPVRETASPLARLHEELDRMFQDFGVWPWGDRGARAPAVDVSEKNGKLIVEAELPGIAREDVKVTYSDQGITIQGETKKEEEEKREGFFRKERRTASFYRLVPLPAAVDYEKATAEFRDGVLCITLPKAEKPAEMARTIPIQ